MWFCFQLYCSNSWMCRHWNELYCVGCSINPVLVRWDHCMWILHVLWLFETQSSSKWIPILLILWISDEFSWSKTDAASFWEMKTNPHAVVCPAGLACFFSGTCKAVCRCFLQDSRLIYLLLQVFGTVATITSTASAIRCSLPGCKDKGVRAETQLLEHVCLLPSLQSWIPKTPHLLGALGNDQYGRKQHW